MTEHTQKLYVGWYDTNQNAWYPVGQLYTDGNRYCFEYLQGASQAQAYSGFRGIFQFSDFDRTYESSELFAFFSNRVLTSSRDNFADEVARLGFDTEPQSLRPFDVLSRTNGRRATDTFEVFPPPEVVDNRAELVFFSRGIRYLREALKRRWEQGRAPQTPLRLKWDKANDFDEHALKILDAEGTSLGYLPRYYSESFCQLVNANCDYDLQIVQHNRQPGFVRERFLMRLTSDTPTEWHFPQSELYEPMNSMDAHTPVVA